MVLARDGLGTLGAVSEILCVTDGDRVFDAVDAALADDSTTVHRLHAGREVIDTLSSDAYDVVVLDLQIGSMGGMATATAIRHEEEAERIDPTRVLMLLDRDADRFLARRCGADGWLVKPLDALRVRRATEALLAGGEFKEREPEPQGSESSDAGGEGSAGDDEGAPTGEPEPVTASQG